MSDDLKKQVSNLWNGFRKKATEAVTSQEVILVRGKVAARAVVDDAGGLIVDAGHLIDEAVIARAYAAGKMHALVGAAVSSQTQDLRERAQKAYRQTPEGQEAHSMGTSDLYIEARRYIGRTAGVDVTDLRGNILVPMGKEIDDNDVRIARDADQLGALIYAAQQPAPNSSGATAPPQPPVPTMPLPGTTSTSQRAARPLASYYDEEPEEK